MTTYEKRPVRGKGRKIMWWAIVACYGADNGERTIADQVRSENDADAIISGLRLRDSYALHLRCGSSN